MSALRDALASRPAPDDNDMIRRATSSIAPSDPELPDSTAVCKDNGRCEVANQGDARGLVVAVLNKNHIRYVA